MLNLSGGGALRVKCCGAPMARCNISDACAARTSSRRVPRLINLRKRVTDLKALDRDSIRSG
jgi:hypothetical protein